PPARALQFDGTGYAMFPQSLKFTAHDFTVSLWFNPTMANKFQFLFMRGFAYADRQGDIGLKINRDSGELDFQARTSDGEWLFGWDVPESRLRSFFNLNQWNHVVVTRRGDTFTMWMNGVNVGSQVSAADISDAEDSNPFIMGGMMTQSGVQDVFQGSLAEVLIYHRALAQDEVNALYRGGRLMSHAPSTYPGGKDLVAGYRFEEGLGKTAHDFSGHGNDGTLHGKVSWVASEAIDSHAVIGPQILIDEDEEKKIDNPPPWRGKGDATFSQSTAAQPIDKNSIIAALKRRQAYFRSGDITWSEDRTKTLFHRKVVDGRPPEAVVHEGVIHVEHQRFAFDGEKKMYFDTATADYGCNGPAHPWERYISAFNGREQRFYDPPGNPLLKHASGDISGPTEEWSDLQTLSFQPIILACRPLHPQLCGLDSNEFTLGSTDVMIDGHRCAELKASETESPGHEETYWLDRDRHWVIVKYESSYHVSRQKGAAGQTTIVNVSYQHDALHGWVPSAWRTEWRNPNTGATHNVEEAKVVKYAFNERISPELFDLPFPPGTFVRDNTQGNPCVCWVAMRGGRKHVLTNAEREANVTYEELLKKEPDTQPGGDVGKGQPTAVPPPGGGRSR
ncbi:MAG: LamG domain-containing protein, partial [Thermoguttaceae bacterium]